MSTPGSRREEPRGRRRVPARARGDKLFLGGNRFLTPSGPQQRGDGERAVPQREPVGANPVRGRRGRVGAGVEQRRDVVSRAPPPDRVMDRPVSVEPHIRIGATRQQQHEGSEGIEIERVVQRVRALDGGPSVK